MHYDRVVFNIFASVNILTSVAIARITIILFLLLFFFFTITFIIIYHDSGWVFFYDKRCAKHQSPEVRPLILIFEMINGKKSWMEKYAQFYHGLGCDVINVGVRL